MVSTSQLCPVACLKGLLQRAGAASKARLAHAALVMASTGSTRLSAHGKQGRTHVCDVGRSQDRIGALKRALDLLWQVEHQHRLIDLDRICAGGFELLQQLRVCGQQGMQEEDHTCIQRIQKVSIIHVGVHHTYMQRIQECDPVDSLAEVHIAKAPKYINNGMIRTYLHICRQQRVQQRDGVDALAAVRLAQEQERHGAENDWPGGNARLLCLEELHDGLGVVGKLPQACKA